MSGTYQQMFLENPRDISNRGVKTRFRIKNEPTISYKDLHVYMLHVKNDSMLKREWINRWVLGTEQTDN